MKVTLNRISHDFAPYYDFIDTCTNCWTLEKCDPYNLRCAFLNQAS